MNFRRALVEFSFHARGSRRILLWPCKGLYRTPLSCPWGKPAPSGSLKSLLDHQTEQTKSQQCLEKDSVPMLQVKTFLDGWSSHEASRPLAKRNISSELTQGPL